MMTSEIMSVGKTMSLPQSDLNITTSNNFVGRIAKFPNLSSFGINHTENE